MSLRRTLLNAPLRLLVHRKNVHDPVDPTQWNDVLVLRYDAIGDLTVTTALFDALRAVAPQAAIDVVTSTRNDILLADDPRIRRHVPFNARLASLPTVRRQLGARSYDVVFSLVFNRTTLAGITANYLGGRRALVVGPAHPGREAAYATWFDVQVPLARKTEPMATLQIRMLEHLLRRDLRAPTYGPSLALAPANRAYAEREGGRLAGSPKVLLNLAAGNDYRLWSAEKNAAFLAALFSRWPGAAVMLCTDATRADVARELHARYPERTAVVAATPDVRDIAALMEHMDIVVTPDTSIVHFADSACTPVVVMYSLLSSHPEEWVPVKARHVLLPTPGRTGIESIDPMLAIEAMHTLGKESGW